MQSGGRALPWADKEAYTRLMLQRSVESVICSMSKLPGPIFSDRGIPDTLCLCPADWLGRRGRHCGRRVRNIVTRRWCFLLLHGEKIYTNDDERKQDSAEGGNRDIYPNDGGSILNVRIDYRSA